jgi:predicted secreted protein with PEFG-CTERM motif
MKPTAGSFTQLSIVLIGVMMVFSVLGNSVYSDHVVGGGGTIDVTAAEGSNIISINGTTDRSGEVIIKVLAPNRNLVSIDQITPTGEGLRLGYSTTLNTSGSLWNQDGDYSITIQQSGGNCTLVGGTSSDDREHDRDAKWSCSAGTAQGFAQFMEGKYNHIVQVGITSGTTSETSISIDYLIEHDEYYVSGQNVPTAKDMKKLTLTADGIQGSTTINVSGTTDKSDEVIIKVTAPNGNVVAIAQITPAGGSFATTIEVGGSLWSQDGTYTVKARQGPTHMSSFATAEGSTYGCNTPSGETDYDGLTSSATSTAGCQMILSQNNFKTADDDNSGWLAYQNSAEVEILDGHVIPEFGVIAAMILAVAIVSIIVVTAKTKLSLVPRY